MNNKNIIKEFINFCKDYLGFKTNVKVILTKDRKKYNIETTAYYDLNGKVICIYIKNRAIIDILRSIAHELVHHKQNEEGRINNHIKDGEDGSEIENEANSKAGEIIRKYGKLNSKVYEN